MNQVKVDDAVINYVVRKTAKRKIYIRVRDGVVTLSVTKKTTKKEIENLIIKNIEWIKKTLEENKKQNVIHLAGIAYKPRFVVGNKNVYIDGEEIVISAKTGDLESYKKVLYEFYKKEVEQKVTSIYETVKKDFTEINIPPIKVRYLKSMFGNYNRKNNEVKLSSMLAKYDYEFVKVVVYHELSHILEFSHSKKFYQVFESKYPNAKKINFMLKKIKYNDCL